MTFSYNANIPQATDNPSVSQGQLLQNINSTSGLVAVDHVGFNTSNGGMHKHVQFNGNNDPGAQTGSKSALYTLAGVANPSSPILIWKNQDQPYYISSMRAWGYISSNGSTVNSQSVGIQAVQNVSTGYYIGTLLPGVVGSANFAVLLTAAASNASLIIVGTGSPISSTQFEMRFWAVNTGALANPPTFSVQINQV